MRVVRLTVAAALLAVSTAVGATFGTVVQIVGGASDIALDEARGRIYLVNTNQERVEVWSVAQKRFLNPIQTDSLPLAAALSADGNTLYVTAHDATALDIIDLNTATLTDRVNLPAKPEGVAVGNDGRVLISTIGTGSGNAQNVLLVWDPNATTTQSLTAVPLTPPPPQSPLLPAPSGRQFLTNRSQLVASVDGQYIIGVNIPNATSRAVFVYETASSTVLRSRTVTNVSEVVSVSPDGSRFMAGLTLFETGTLQIIGQQNMASAPYPFPNGANFNTQQNQGGSIFSPDGSTLYSAFNIAPVQTPAARANVSQLMSSDPDNLLIRSALQLTENLAGKMVISSDGGTIYALSESGFLILPVSTVNQFPIANPDSTVSLLTNDQCGVFGDRKSSSVNIRNDGRGRMTVTAQLLQTTPTGPGGLGGNGGAGGGAPGGGVVITIPGGGGTVVIPAPPTLPGGFPTGQNGAVVSAAPGFRVQNNSDSSRLDLSFTTAAAAKTPGTVSPTHTLLLQSDQAINIPPAVRVFQNYRNAESRGDVVPIPVGLSANEALVDLAMDSRRQKVYIANSGLNRVEVYDVQSRQLLSPLKVGQLPRSLAITPDGSTMYVANSGGESISVVDLEGMRVTGRIKFPPLPFNSAAAVITPSLLAASERALHIIMNNGSIWQVVGDEAVPRPVSPVIGTSTIPAPRTVAATPNGENVILVAGNGFVYLYDAMADDFVQSRQVFSNPIQGYYGPVTAGPRGQYYIVNGTVLNSTLTPTGTPAITPAAARPVSAVAVATPTSFLRFSQPTRANANAAASDSGLLEIVDAAQGLATRSAPALEGPISTQTGTTRVNIDGRTLAFDPASNTAFALTASGLSVIPMDPQPATDRPAIREGGTVNLSSGTASFAPGGLVSIFGRNLAGDGKVTSGAAPTLLGGVCVTLNTTALPLLMTSSAQINAQLPVELAAGRYSLVVRNVDKNLASPGQNITLARYAPGIMADPDTKQALVYRASGEQITRDNRAQRDEPLVLFATGLGVATTGGKIASGQPSPDDPLAEVSDTVTLYFGDPRYKQAEIIVDQVSLPPGLIGVYQVNLRVPGFHMKGSDLPVLLKIGGVPSQTTGPMVPTIAVD